MDKNILQRLVRGFLEEDIGRGDMTSESIFTAEEGGTARFVARDRCLIAGLEEVVPAVFKAQNAAFSFANGIRDGQHVESGTSLLEVRGPVVDMLKAERVALNLLQRLSGIATLTRQFVDRVREYRVQITDTRKTTPGLRMLEKYAVSVGGGYNHRFNLADGILIKDNHIAACGSISEAVARVRRRVPHTMRIEVETDTLQQVEESIACGVDIIMLDNMDTTMLREAVQRIDGRALVEASGGVSLETVEDIARCGVDIISVGALTHSALACDIGLDWL
ncbi:MAG: nicotinate-nucleotide diphosphorylase (carboxylating) [Deltaproteobacteria bacterium]|nr:MAG: nicotinate-nucleotide diphosphorylase (carboxylating) [Deltaproteobacteria bacterium]PIE72947.1 MAG: nicotinate-nucleotide diphosphorylase (carboxylating) [Deltaproteobacteria bacterium]